ncbi:MAG TPA: MBL fold metallo-hydrolase [Patescibacteria group bacterium]|nr:MBL fold metallo-hydrolase [Patescibacteria group bacterium]
MQIWKYIYGFLTLILVGLIIAIFQIPDSNLHIIVCDVGQGDAILITYKNTQVLTDGGPDQKVISCLSKYMPFWDREIELVISTHPDADHSTGLIDVIKRYNVDKIAISPIDSGTQTIKALENAVGGRGVEVLTPVDGMRLGLGMIYLDIVNPSHNQIGSLSQKVDGSPLGFFKPIDATNEYSISYKLSFGSFSGLFTGDFGQGVSDRLALENKIGSVNYIKVPHHGSRNGLTENLLKQIMPKFAVISVGKNNRYGHPHKEILDMLNKYNVKIFRTDEVGDVGLVTDGKNYWIKN